MVNNEGCNFRKVENVVQLAEARHYNTVVHLPETASHEHLQQMANLTREAQLALHRQAEEYTLEKQSLQREAVIYVDNMAKHHAAHSARVNQLEMALELQENNMCKFSPRRNGNGKRWSPALGAPTTAQSTVLQAALTTTTLCLTVVV